MTLADKARRISVVALDIDGVLTNGLIGYDGHREIKFFHVRDGHGIKLAKRAGLRVGAFSGRTAEANQIRARELDFDFLYQNIKNKREGFRTLLQEQETTPEQCLYIGDDLVDIPVLHSCGVAVTVADAPAILDSYCDFRTRASGGTGAVREVLEWLLKEQDKWDTLMERYIP